MSRSPPAERFGSSSSMLVAEELGACPERGSAPRSASVRSARGHDSLYRTKQKVDKRGRLCVLCDGQYLIQAVSGAAARSVLGDQTPSGGQVVAVHFQPQGVTGVDRVTGAVFHATGLTRDRIVNSPPGGTTETFVNRFHIQATRGGESFIISDLFHVTVTPDGTVRVLFDNFSATC